jgi:mannose-6-phosphate isomerase-like protein (cupin superfamily)
MAKAGDELENPVTGERLIFRKTAADTGGELLELDAVWTRAGHRLPEHVHPEMEERWEVLQGRAIIRVGDVEHELGPGDAVVAPAGTPHVAWNPTSEEVVVREQFRPALRWEEVCEEFARLGREGRINERGVPDPEATAEILRRYPREIAPPPA